MDGKGLGWMVFHLWQNKVQQLRSTLGTFCNQHQQSTGRGAKNGHFFQIRQQKIQLQGLRNHCWQRQNFGNEGRPFALLLLARWQGFLGRNCRTSRGAFLQQFLAKIAQKNTHRVLVGVQSFSKCVSSASRLSKICKNPTPWQVFCAKPWLLVVAVVGVQVNVQLRACLQAKVHHFVAWRKAGRWFIHVDVWHNGKPQLAVALLANHL